MKLEFHINQKTLITTVGVILLLGSAGLNMSLYRTLDTERTARVDLIKKNQALSTSLDQIGKEKQQAEAGSEIAFTSMEFLSTQFDRLDGSLQDMDALLGDYDDFVRDRCYTYGDVTNQYQGLANRYETILVEYTSISQDMQKASDILRGYNAGLEAGNEIQLN